MTTATATQGTLPRLAFLGSIHEGIPVRNMEYLDKAIKFYTEVLGLKLLPRPKLPGPGAWLGDEDNTVQFHLIVTEKDYKPGPDAAISATGRHTAWMVKDLNVFRARMKALGVHYEERTGLVASDQLFVKDPEGHTWEFQEPK
jgi:catechol 2,3-dioxygenase-like lactoylglutathione lyase family enzyme